MASIAPHFIHLVSQTGSHHDCGVAALALFAGVLYEDALVAFDRPSTVLKRGVYWTEVVSAAKRLGIKSTVRRRFNVNEDTGILRMKDLNKDEHMVYLWAGRVVDGSEEAWLYPSDYFDHGGYDPTGLLVRVE